MYYYNNKMSTRFEKTVKQWLSANYLEWETTKGHERPWCLACKKNGSYDVVIDKSAGEPPCMRISVRKVRDGERGRQKIMHTSSFEALLTETFKVPCNHCFEPIPQHKFYKLEKFRQNKREESARGEQPKEYYTNINTIPRNHLEKIIGKFMANRIIECRNFRPFENWSNFQDRILGISKVKINHLRQSGLTLPEVVLNLPPMRSTSSVQD